MAKFWGQGRGLARWTACSGVGELCENHRVEADRSTSSKLSPQPPTPSSIVVKPPIKARAAGGGRVATSYRAVIRSSTRRGVRSPWILPVRVVERGGGATAGRYILVTDGFRGYAAGCRTRTRRMTVPAGCSRRRARIRQVQRRSVRCTAVLCSAVRCSGLGSAARFPFLFGVLSDVKESGKLWCGLAGVLGLDTLADRLEFPAV